MAEDDKGTTEKPTKAEEGTAEENKKKPAFDDLLKFGRYTKFLTIVFFLLLTTQSLQLLFMSFAGTLIFFLFLSFYLTLKKVFLFHTIWLLFPSSSTIGR